MKIQGASIRRFIDKPDKAVRAVLLYGPNESFSHEAAQKLAAWAVGKSDDPYAVTKLGDDDIKKDTARLVDALSAQSLLGGPTVVWARINGKGADAAIVDALEGFERDEPLGYLIVEAGDLGSTAELVKKFTAAKNAAVVAFYEETDAERAQHARGLAKDMAISFDRDAEDLFLSALPVDRGLATKEIEKLALYAHGLGRPISIADLEALMTDEGESALDAASLAAAQGKAAQAIEALARIDALSGISALRALLRRLHQLREARLLIDGGMSPSDAIGKLRPPVFWKERDAVAAQARLWNGKKLNAAFDILWSAELRSKTAGAPQELIAADAYRGVAKLVGN
ncbi:DNA polymerase III subunit delta [Terricaulis sp.]|uniref:DNA polymerase III subunit delta n=1 Tax=Terricaulis sp. TaxID=2768686 RepID=UPI002AC4D358|nr:DNA polymerase III subunit delta [Terricaulis sp.]MDZ4691088.1 DNA polymerase III subunit delta [Terricaulis sp.]